MPACCRTVSTRSAKPPCGVVSSICSTIKAPIGFSRRRRGSSPSGLRVSGSTATIFVCDSSTYFSTVRSTCGGRLCVSPSNHSGSRVAATSEASLASERTVLAR